MSRKTTPFQDSPRSAVYFLYLEYCDRTNTIPRENAFWECFMTVKDASTGKSPAEDMCLTKAAFRYYWAQLRYVDGLIEIIDPGGIHGIRLVERELVETAYTDEID